jgi:DNA-binding NtrC family response regulator
MAYLLVVDDEAAVADAVSLVLRAEGHDVESCGEAAQALDRLSSGRFDGAILDVWLGADNGLRLAEGIGTMETPCPFIIMSGGGPGRTLENATAAADALGASRVLFKPFDDDELLSAVDAMLGRHSH